LCPINIRVIRRQFCAIKDDPNKRETAVLCMYAPSPTWKMKEKETDENNPDPLKR